MISRATTLLQERSGQCGSRHGEEPRPSGICRGVGLLLILALFPFLILLRRSSPIFRSRTFLARSWSWLVEWSRRQHGSSQKLDDRHDFATHSRLLTFGIVFTLWSASSGFTALIDALNTAYDVSETRRYWKTRSLAIGLTFSVGCLLVVALGLLLVGPSLSARLTEAVGMGHLWPYVRWTVAIGCTVLAVELLYFVAPNVKQRFVSTLPGALIAVGGWIGLSGLLESTSRIFPPTARVTAAWEWRSYSAFGSIGLAS